MTPRIHYFRFKVITLEPTAPASLLQPSWFYKQIPSRIKPACETCLIHATPWRAASVSPLAINIPGRAFFDNPRFVHRRFDPLHPPRVVGHQHHDLADLRFALDLAYLRLAPQAGLHLGLVRRDGGGRLGTRAQKLIGCLHIALDEDIPARLRFLGDHLLFLVRRRIRAQACAACQSHRQSCGQPTHPTRWPRQRTFLVRSRFRALLCSAFASKTSEAPPERQLHKPHFSLSFL